MTLPRTLPAIWYTSQALNELERRAVFLRSWYFLGTISKFETGQEIHFELAQVGLTARTNFNSKKKLVTIFDDTTDKELRSYQTRTGLVFTSISSAAPSFEDFFPGLEDLLDAYDFSEMPLRRSITYPGKYNWKTLIDGFQECLHCQLIHPAFSKLFPTTFYQVVNYHNWSRHNADSDRLNDGLFLYFFPNCALNLYNGGMSSFRVCPSPHVGLSRMEFDYYNHASGEKFEEYYDFVRQVADEDSDICEQVQANLEKGIYREGCLNPVKETGVIHYQQKVLDMVTKQHLEEKTRIQSPLQ